MTKPWLSLSTHTHQSCALSHSRSLAHTHTHLQRREKKKKFYKQRFSLGSRQLFWRLIAATNKAVRHNNIQCLLRESRFFVRRAPDWCVSGWNVSTPCFKRDLLNVALSSLKERKKAADGGTKRFAKKKKKHSEASVTLHEADMCLQKEKIKRGQWRARWAWQLNAGDKYATVKFKEP